MNEAGEAVAVWEHSGSEQKTVVAKTRTPAGEWGPLEPLSPEGSPYTSPGVAVGPAGEAVAVWCQYPTYGPSSRYRIESSFRPAGGHWEAAVTLSDPEYDSYSPQVAIAPTGKIVAAWDGFYGEDGDQTVQVAEMQGGRWGEPQAVSGGPSSWWPKVAAGTAGATVVWQSEEGLIEAASQPAGGEWQPPVELAGPESTEPEIGADAAGNAVAIWRSEYEPGAEYVEGAAHPVGGPWSEPTVIAGPVPNGETGLDLAVASNGQTLAAWSVWQREGTHEERYVEEASGLEGEWEEPTTLSQAGAWAVRPAVALDSQGDGAVAWWAANRHLPQATEFVAPRPGAPPVGEEPPHSNSGPPKRGRAKAGRIALVRDGKAYLHLRCPGTSACEGNLRLLARLTGRKGKPTRISAGAVHFTIPAGRKRFITVPLDRKGRSLISASEKSGVHARLRGGDVEPRGLLLRPAAGR